METEKIITYFLKQLQMKMDQISGLKIQNKLLRKENEKLEYENIELANSLSTVNHELKSLEKTNDELREKYGKLSYKYDIAMNKLQKLEKDNGMSVHDRV